jgi:hypothetical protein
MPETQQSLQPVPSLGFPKQPPWKRCLDKAMRESNDEKLLSLVHATEWSLVRRWEELRGDGKALAELAAMESACNRLLDIKVFKLGWPDTRR